MRFFACSQPVPTSSVLYSSDWSLRRLKLFLPSSKPNFRPKNKDWGFRRIQGGQDQPSPSHWGWAPNTIRSLAKVKCWSRASGQYYLRSRWPIVPVWLMSMTEVTIEECKYNPYLLSLNVKGQTRMYVWVGGCVGSQPMPSLWTSNVKQTYACVWIPANV